MLPFSQGRERARGFGVNGGNKFPSQHVEVLRTGADDQRMASGHLHRTHACPGGQRQRVRWVQVSASISARPRPIEFRTRTGTNGRRTRGGEVRFGVGESTTKTGRGKRGHLHLAQVQVSTRTNTESFSLSASASARSLSVRAPLNFRRGVDGWSTVSAAAGNWQEVAPKNWLLTKSTKSLYWY